MPRQRNTVARKKFKKWLAIPKGKREEATGVGTQKELAKVLGVATATLSRWKKKPGFMDGVEHERRLHLDQALSDVYDTMIERAKEGDPQHTKMVLEQAGRYKEEVKPTDVGPSEEDVSNASNTELAGMIAEMLSDAPGVGEAQLQMAILQSLGEDIPKKLKKQVTIEAKAAEGAEATEEAQVEEDPQVEEDEEETEEDDSQEKEEANLDEDDWTPEEEEWDEQTQEEFELEDHLMGDLGGTEDENVTEEEDEIEPTESTEEFEIPLEW